MPTQSRTTLRVGPLLIELRLGASFAAAFVACGALSATTGPLLTLLGTPLAFAASYRLLGHSLRIHADQHGITVVRP